MWVVRVETPGAKLKLLEVFHLDICFFQNLDHVETILTGRMGHGAFFFLYNPVENPIELWYATSYMKNLSMENIDNICGDFSTLYILMKVLFREAYRFAMFRNTSIITWDIQGLSFSKIIVYRGVMK